MRNSVDKIRLCKFPTQMKILWKSNVPLFFKKFWKSRLKLKESETETLKVETADLNLLFTLVGLMISVMAQQSVAWIGLKIEIGWLFHLPAQSAKNCSSKKIHYYWSASSFFITMKLSPLLSQKRTVLLLLLFLFAIERLSLPPERGHNFIVIPGRFSHNTKSADAIFCLSTSMSLTHAQVSKIKH